MSSRRLLSAKAKYGFNGQLKDNEVYGEGNSTTAEFWQYDPRLGRRMNMDPVDHVFVSSYSTFNNNPVFVKDPSGAVGEPNQKNGELKTIVYLKRGENVKEEDFKKLVDNFSKSVESIFEGMKYTNKEGKEVSTHVIVDVRVVTDKPTSFKNGENYFEVTTSGVSHVDANMTTGMLNINEVKDNAKVIAHEWGHLFGLQDRYHLLFSYDKNHALDLRDESRKTLPMILTLDFDKEYNPYNNLYSSGTNITKYQKDVLFGNSSEKPYSQAMLFVEDGKKLTYTAVEISDGIHKYSGNRKLGEPESWATSTKFSNSIPFNCDGQNKHHSKNATKAVREYFKK